MNNEVEKAFPKVWNDLLEDRTVTPQEKPLGVVLGGAPGSGKSVLIRMVDKSLNNNVVPVNGDDFRIYHPNFKKIYDEHKGDYPKYTSEFSNKMVERVIDEALKNKFNVVVEGTFRNPQVPIDTLSDFAKNGYETKAMVIATDKEVAYQSTIDRYNDDLKNGFYARKVDKNTFDLVVNNLANNAKIVLDSGKASSFEVYSRSEKLFDSKIDSADKLKSCINNELNKTYKLEFKFEKEISDKNGIKNYSVWLNDKPIQEAIKSEKFLEVALNKVAENVKELRDKGVTAESLKSGLIQPKRLENEIKVNKPNSITINGVGKQVKEKSLQKEKSAGMEL